MEANFSPSCEESIAFVDILNRGCDFGMLVGILSCVCTKNYSNASWDPGQFAQDFSFNLKVFTLEISLEQYSR